MTPMDENELRRELAQVTVPQRDDSALTASVIARGRGIKRRRGIVAALAAALVAVGGIGLGASLMPGETTAPATASPSPAPSTSPSQTILNATMVSYKGTAEPSIWVNVVAM